MTTSLAAVYEGTSGKIHLRELLTPQPSGTEVLVKVLACTLCGSDLHSFEGRRKVPVPTILGHEIVGEITEFGETSSRVDMNGHELKLGDRVTWAIVASCGECELCERDLPQKCLNAVKYGHEAFRPGRELLGGLAEHCLLTPGTAIIKLPGDMPLAVACPASCATATVVAAMEAAGEMKGRSICIFGAGMLGLTACALARSMGTAEVLCVDPVLERRQRATQFGATRVARPDEFEVVKGKSVGKFGFDTVIELSGHLDAVKLGYGCLRLGGTLVLVGSVFPVGSVLLEPEVIVRRNLTIKGVHNYAPQHLVAAVKFLSEQMNITPFEQLVTEWFPLQSIAAAFEHAAKPGTVRVGVYPGDRP